MRKYSLLFFSFFLYGVLLAGGQHNTSSSDSYKPDPYSGDVVPILNVYLGPSIYKTATPSMSFFGSYEIPAIDPNLTLGPEIGFGMGGNINGVSTSTLALSVKATYYADWLIPNMPDEFDVFLTSTAGLYILSGTSGSSGLQYGNYVGGRWHFSENMSIYGQVGYGNLFIAGGISIKF